MDRGLRQVERPFAAGWFDVWLRLFLAGITGGLAVVALSPIDQMKVIGALACACALLGALVCAIGVRLYHPARWRELTGHVSSLGESLRGATEAIGEPRHAAYARMVTPLDLRHPGR
jgi:hypothetical protein